MPNAPVKGFKFLTNTGNGSVSKYGHHHRCRGTVPCAYSLHMQCGLECVGLGVCFGTDWDGMLSLVEERDWPGGIRHYKRNLERVVGGWVGWQERKGST